MMCEVDKRGVDVLQHFANHIVFRVEPIEDRLQGWLAMTNVRKDRAVFSEVMLPQSHALPLT